MTTEKKIVKLQINTKGGWRDMLQFDAEDGDDVMDHAEKLFEWAYDPSAKGMSARIIMPGDVPPLYTWTKAKGWKEWRAAK